MFKISVIIPVYKVEPFLCQCVDSVLLQTYQNIEVILVDDGSPDGCAAICDEYARNDKRVVVVHQNNRGLSAARNAGIQVASGDYIAFLDGDDFWCDSAAMERLVDRLRLFKTDVLNYSYVKCTENGQVISKQFDRVDAMPQTATDADSQLTYITNHALYIASACNKLINKERLSNTLFEESKTSEDIEWCARLMRDAASFDFVCENFYFYRQRSGSMTHSFGEKSCLDLADNICRCISVIENAPQDRKCHLCAYTAYQFATFFAVQALSSSCPKECIERLLPHWQILQYYGSSRKVKCLYWGCRAVGFANMCRLTKLTRKLWA